MKSMYLDLQRRFKLYGAVGEEFKAKNGILHVMPLQREVCCVLAVCVCVWCARDNNNYKGERGLLF